MKSNTAALEKHRPDTGAKKPQRAGKYPYGILPYGYFVYKKEAA